MLELALIAFFESLGKTSSIWSLWIYAGGVAWASICLIAPWRLRIGPISVSDTSKDFQRITIYLALFAVSIFAMSHPSIEIWRLGALAFASLNGLASVYAAWKIYLYSGQA